MEHGANIKPSNPVLAGLCKQADLDAAVAKAHRKLKREGKPIPGAESIPAANIDADAGSSSSGDFAVETFGTVSNDAGDQPDYYDRDAANS